jgi:hypothetical protein
MSFNKKEDINFNNKAISILCKALNLNDINKAIDKNYKDININNDIDKEKSRLYSTRIRGSVRIGTQRFYTTKEYNKRKTNIESFKLP